MKILYARNGELVEQKEQAEEEVHCLSLVASELLDARHLVATSLSHLSHPAYALRIAVHPLIHRWQITELEGQILILKGEEERLTKLKDQQAARNWQVNVKLAKFETVKMQRDQLEEQVSKLTNNSEVQTLQHAVR